MDAPFEIHKSACQKDSYLVVVDNKSVIDYSADRVCRFRDSNYAANCKIWCSKNLK